MEENIQIARDVVYRDIENLKESFMTLAICQGSTDTWDQNKVILKAIYGSYDNFYQAIIEHLD